MQVFSHIARKARKQGKARARTIKLLTKPVLARSQMHAGLFRVTESLFLASVSVFLKRYYALIYIEFRKRSTVVALQGNGHSFPLDATFEKPRQNLYDIRINALLNANIVPF